MRLVGYARVSTEDQGAFGVSLDAQADRIRGYCAALGHDLVDLVARDESAKDLDRDGLRHVLARLDAGDADGVVVAKVDRLTRDVGDWQDLLRRYFCVAAGKSIHSVAESADTATAKGRFLLTLHVALAQLERETIVERTQESLDFKRSRNMRTGGVPYGFDLDENGPKNRNGRPVGLLENAVERLVAARILEMRASGLGTRAIAADLNRDGVPTKTRRGPWTHKAVAKVLDRFGRAAP